MTLDGLRPDDVGEIVAAFAALGWPGKDRAQYERYLTEQADGSRDVVVARADGEFAGYLTILWRPGYPPFHERGIAEVQDMNVLPHLRRRGIATAMMDVAEARQAERAPVAGIGVGLYADYGPAHAMYLARGYRPDGHGVAYHGRTVAPGGEVRVDDALALMLTKPLR